MDVPAPVPKVDVIKEPETEEPQPAVEISQIDPRQAGTLASRVRLVAEARTKPPEDPKAVERRQDRLEEARIIMALCRTMASGESAPSSQTLQQMRRLRDEWQRQGRSGLSQMLAQVIEQAETALLTPVVWPNHADLYGPEALRYLARNPRPAEGESRFNAAHLLQLADDIETLARRALFDRTAKPTGSKEG